MAGDPSEEWLTEANGRYRAADVPPRQRPWLAWKDYAEELQLGLALDDARVQRIFAWFTEHTKAGAHQTGALFQGAFFFDACFWPVDIPIGYGTFELDMFGCLRDMPRPMKQALARDRDALEQLLILWTSCVDYGFGFHDIEKEEPPGQPREFLSSAHRELCACVGLLLSARPTAKAAHTASLAIELFAKWLLATREALNAEAAKKLGHRLVPLLERCRVYVPEREIAAHIARARLMPSINERYAEAEPPPKYLWEAYLTAQSIAASLTRAVSGRDSDSSVQLGGARRAPGRLGDEI